MSRFLQYTKRTSTRLALLALALLVVALCYEVWPATIGPGLDYIEVYDSKNRKGLINSLGQLVLPCQYSYIYEPDKLGWRMVIANDKSGWVDSNFRQVLPSEWESAKPFDQHSMALVRKDGKYGAINRQGEIVIPLEWDELTYYDFCDLARVVKQGWVFWMDRAGKVVDKPPWDWCDKFDSSGQAIFRRNNKYGIINKDGKILIPAEWKECQPFDANGLAAVRNERGSWGYINRDLKEIVPCSWHQIGAFGNQGLAPVNSTGGVATSTKVIDGKFFCSSEIIKAKGEFIDRNNQAAFASKWTSCDTFDKHGLARVYRDRKCGWIDRNGIEVIPCQWLDSCCYYESKEISATEIRGGHISINPTFFIASVESYSDSQGWILVENGKGEWGCIDRQNNPVFPFDWTELSSFDEKGLALARIGNSAGVVNRQAERKIAIEWESIALNDGANGNRYYTCTRTVERQPWISFLLNKASEWFNLDIPSSNLCHVYDPDFQLLWRSDDWRHDLPWMLCVVSGCCLFLAILFRLIERRKLN